MLSPMDSLAKRKQDVGKHLPQCGNSHSWLHCPGENVAKKPPSPDRVVQGEKKWKKTNPKQLNHCDNKTPFSPNNNQWETSGKKNKIKRKKHVELLLSKTSQMLLSSLLCATGQGLSQWWQVHRQWKLERAQQLELVDCGCRSASFPGEVVLSGCSEKKVQR